MAEYHGSVLTSNTLAFGILAFCFVCLRVGFRIHIKKTSASDWVLVIAMVSCSLPLPFSKESIEGALTPSVALLGLLLLLLMMSIK